MNIRNVLKVYGLLRQFSDDEAALLQTLRSLTEAEQQQMMEALGPQVKRKVAKKVVSKSPRANSLQRQIQTRALDGGVSKMRCVYHADGGSDPVACGQYADANIHHLLTDESYHEFIGAQAQAASGD